MKNKNLVRINRVEIEIHSYCNRKCDWCPNKSIDRSFYKEMKEEIFLKILKDLKVVWLYNNILNIISLSKFNEPTYNISLLEKRINQVRKYLPNVKVNVNTNGDYLRFIDLGKVKPHFLSIMDYDDIGKEKCIERLKKLGLKDIKETSYRSIGGHYKNTYVRYRYNWKNNSEIEDRAGLLRHVDNIKWKNDKVERNYNCYASKRPLSIDYNGNITPCCHIRADAEKHAEYVLGNIENISLYDLIRSGRVKNFDKLNLPSICQYCHKEGI